MPIAEILDSISDYIQEGGFIMPPLVVATFVLWYALGYRFLTLRRGAVRSVRMLLQRHEEGKAIKGDGIVPRAILIGTQLAEHYPNRLRRALDDAFAEFDRDLKAGKVLISSIVSIAPLAGLLGTVDGMIETFDSLADMALYSSGGGIAGGISQALLTTQMGLVVAVPGVVIGRLLDRRQSQLELELNKIKDLLCAKAAERRGLGHETA